ncbi:hypothetical protein [Aliiroseovarius sp.]|uniref:hypothetical protein n=1 Tax=Aliiroseovarius sp. TaxID=1872442 RepID=UPI003BAA1B84
MSFESSIAARIGAACLALALPFAATAQDAGSFDLQLNAAAGTTAGSCRLTYVAANQSELAFDRTAFEVGVFDADGAVTRLLVLEFGALIAGKTKILQFDLGETPCESISRIVVNDVAACTQPDGTESGFCMSGLVASSRTAIQFGI